MNKSRLTLTAFVWACIPTALLLWIVTRLWPQAPGIAASQPINERVGTSLIIALGAIGGYIRWMHYLAVIVEDPEKIWQWLIDSALTPLKGAALALVFCIAFRAGLTIQTPQGASGNVNWMGLYALASIAGLFSPDAIKRLEVTFQAMFAPVHDHRETQPQDVKGDGAEQIGE